MNTFAHSALAAVARCFPLALSALLLLGSNAWAQDNDPDLILTGDPNFLVAVSTGQAGETCPAERFESTFTITLPSTSRVPVIPRVFLENETSGTPSEYELGRVTCDGELQPGDSCAATVQLVSLPIERERIFLSTVFRVEDGTLQLGQREELVVEQRNCVPPVDRDPPTLAEFFLPTAPIDVTSDSQSIVIDLALIDASGVESVGAITFQSPSGEETVTSDIPTVADSDPGLEGFFTTLVIPQDAEPGIWTAQRFTVRDINGNAGTVAPGDAGSSGTIVVVNNADTEPPLLSRFSLSSRSIDVTSMDVRVDIELSLFDDSGVLSVGAIPFVSPLGERLTSSVPTPSDAGRFTASVIFPQGSEAGTWDTERFTVVDTVGNNGTVRPEDVESTGTIVVANNADTTPPTLGPLTIAPTTIDTQFSQATVVIAYSASDDQSGISSGPNLVFEGPSSQIIRATSRQVMMPGEPGEVFFEAAFTFPQFSQEGTWFLRGFRLTDNDDNSVFVSPEAILTVTSIQDTTPPTLGSFNFSPDRIDTQFNDVSVILSYSALDDQSGISRGSDATFIGPSGQSITSTSRQVAGEGMPGEVFFEATFSFPEGSEPGRWILSDIRLVDEAGNANVVDTGSQVLTVTRGVDSTPPTLESLSFSPTTIDTQFNQASVMLTYSVSDIDSDTNVGSNLLFLGPNGDVIESPSGRVPGDVTVGQGIFEAEFNFPQLSEPGIWELQDFILSDDAGNSVSVNAASQGLPFQVTVTNIQDTTPPTLEASSISPDLIDTAFDSADVLLDFSIIDDLSGVADASGFIFTHTSGDVVGGELTGPPTTDSSGLVEYQVVFQFPQSSESGTWTLNPINVIDESGNRGTVSAEPDVLTVDNTDRRMDQAVTMVAREVRAQESMGSVEIVLERRGDSEGFITAELITNPEDSDDFQGINDGDPLIVSWEDGVTGTQSVFIPINDDDITESDESFDVRIISAFGVFARDVDRAIPVLVDLTTVIIQSNDIPTDPVDFEFDAEFGPVTVGSSPLTSPFVVINNAQFPVGFVVPPAFADGSVFSIAGGSCTSLPSGALEAGTSCELTVQFNPAEVGMLTDTLRLELEDQVSGEFFIGSFETTYVGTVIEAAAPGVLQFAEEAISIDEDAGFVILTVNRSGGGDGTASVDFSTEPGTADAVDDFEERSGTLQWEAGETGGRTLMIPLVADAVPEDPESFTVILSNPTGSVDGLSLGPIDTTTVTLLDVSPPEPGQVQFVTDGLTVSEEDGSVDIVVERVGERSDGDVSVLLTTRDGPNQTTIDGTATSGSDYIATTQTLEWEDGDFTSRTVSIGILPDSIGDEETEVFTVILSDAVPDEALGIPNVLEVSITDVPPLEPGVLQFAQEAISINEDAGAVMLTVTRTDGSDGTASVDFTTVAGSALAGEDFVAATNSVSWQDGESGDRTLMITLLADELLEDPESFTVQLSNPVGSVDGLSLGEADTATVTLIDVPVPVAGPVQFATDSLTVGEEDGSVNVVVERGPGSDGNVSVLLTTSDGTAFSGLDYTATTQTLEWDEGDTTPRIVSIAILPDLIGEEGTEVFTVTLSGAEPDEALGTPNVLTVSITDVPPLEPGVLQFAETAISINEDAGAVMLTVTRTDGSDGTASVDFATVAGSALAGEDFVAATNTVSWQDGESGDRTLMITLLADELLEDPETFTVQLSNPVGSVDGLSLGEADTATVTLIDVLVPEPGQIQFATESLTVGEEDGAVEVVVQRVDGSDGDVSVLVATNNGTASDGLDYTATTQTLQWEDGDITPRIVSINILSDLIGDEETEVFTITLSDPQPDTQVLGTPNVLTVSITDVPPPQLGVVQMAQSELTLPESGGTFNLGVVRVGGSDGEISVNYAFTDDSAVAGDDFTGTNGTLVFGDGDSETQFISGTVLTDELEEGNESFTVTLTDATPEEALADDALLGTVITIEDEFVPPPVIEPGQILFAQDSLMVTEDDDIVQVVVQRVGGSDGSVSVLLDTNAGTASSGLDYTNTTQVLEWDDGDTTTRTVSIGILSDLVNEETENFTVTLSNPQPNDQVLGTPSVLTVSIINVPPPAPGVLQFTQEAISVNEDAGSVVLTVTRTGGSDGTAQVDFTSAAGTAQPGQDFMTRAGTLSWADGETGVRTIMIDLLADVLEEGPESFTVQLSNPVGSVPGLLVGAIDTATVTLIDAPVPQPGQVQFAQDSLTVEEEDGTVAIVVQRVGGSDGDVSVQLNTNDGTANSDLDYTTTTQTLQWADGDSTPRTVSIGILSDLLLETTETFTVTLNDPLPEAQVLGTPDVLTVSITDVPPLRQGVLQMAQTELSLTESGGEFSLGVVRVGGSDGVISVNYAFNSGTATAGEDFTGTNGTLVFGDGDSETQFISGLVLTDVIEEGSETFTVTLTGATPADALGSGALLDVVITIEDEFEAPPLPEPGQVQFAQNSLTVSEDGGAVNVVVQRVGGSDGNVSVLLDTNAGTASSGSDYTNTTQILQWADGDTSTRTVSIGILSDLLVEEIEVFTVTLNDPQPTDQVLGTPSLLMVMITDVPPPVILQPGAVQFADTRISVNEDAGSVMLTVTRTGGSDGTAQVDFTTVGGTALPGEDFNTRSGTLSWADGETGFRTIMVDLLADELEEGSESFTVQLSNPIGSVPGFFLGSADTASVNLIDVPVEVPVIMAGQVSVVSTRVTVAEIDESAGVVVERSGGSQGALSVEYTTLDVSAVASEDYTATSGTLTWRDGEIGTRRVEIPIVADGQAEASETFRFVLSNPVSSIAEADELLGASEALIIIEDSTQPGVIRFVETNVGVAESDGEVQLRVIREGGSDGAVSVQYTVAGNTATAGDDFVDDEGELSWDSGESGERIIRIEVREDAQFEANETFTVTLSDARPFGDEQLGNAQAVVTITDSSEAGELVVSQSAVTVDEAMGEVIIGVERRAGFAGAVQLNVRAENGTAFERTDYLLDTSELNWESGEDGVRQIRLRILDDNVDEIDEQFTLQLSLGNPDNTDTPQVTLNQSSVSIRIQDNDLPVPEQADPVTLAEAGGFRLRVIGGDNQIGNPGDEIEPIVIEVIDSGNNDAPVPNVQVRWRVIPEGAVEFLDGTGGTADAQGRVSFRVRVIERGFNTLIASVDTSALSSGLSSRMVRQNIAIAETEIAIIVRGGLVASAGLIPNQATTVNALEEACEVLGVRIEGGNNITPEQQDLFDTCTELRTQLDDPNLGAALDRLAGEEFFAFDDSIIQINDIQVTNVYSRLNAIRSGREETWDVSGLQLQIYDQNIPGSVVNAAQNAMSGGAASADSFADSRLGTFVNGTVSYGEVDGNGRQRDGELETSGLTVGLDYRATNQVVFGAGVGVTKTSTDFTGDEGGSEVDAYNVTLFGTWYEPREGYVDAVLDFGRNDYTSNRRVNLPGSVDQFATGSTNADVAALTIGVGRDYSVGGWEFGPYGRVSIVRAEVNGFSESIAERVDGFGSGLDYAGRTIRSSAISIGGQVTRTINTSKAVFLPQLRIEYETETQRNKDPITATFQNDPSNTPFDIVGNKRDRTHLNIGVGSSFILRGGRSGYVFYETQAQNALVTQHWLKLGIRLEF